MWYQSSHEVHPTHLTFPDLRDSQSNVATLAKQNDTQITMWYTLIGSVNEIHRSLVQFWQWLGVAFPFRVSNIGNFNGRVKEYPTMHYSGIPRRTQPIIAYMTSSEWFRDFRVSQSTVALWERYKHVIFISATLAKENDTQITCSKWSNPAIIDSLWEQA